MLTLVKGAALTPFTAGEACEHLWVQVSTTTDPMHPRRCQCLAGCRRVQCFTEPEWQELLAAGKVKLAVKFPGIGTW